MHILTALEASSAALPCKFIPTRRAHTNMAAWNESSGWLSILAYYTRGLRCLSSLSQFLLQASSLVEQSVMHCQLLTDQRLRVLFHHFGRLELLVGLAATSTTPTHIVRCHGKDHQLNYKITTSAPEFLGSPLPSLNGSWGLQSLVSAHEPGMELQKQNTPSWEWQLNVHILTLYHVCVL